MHSFIKPCENIIEIILFHKLFYGIFNTKIKEALSFCPDKRPPYQEVIVLVGRALV